MYSWLFKKAMISVLIINSKSMLLQKAYEKHSDNYNDKDFHAVL